MKKFILLVVAALLCVATTIDAVAQRRDKATDTNLVGHVIDARTREHIAYAARRSVWQPTREDTICSSTFRRTPS